MSSQYDELSNQLNSKDTKLQFAAIEALATLEDNRGTELLLPILQSRNESLVKAAATALGVRKDPRAVHPLIQALSVGDYYCHESKNALVKIGTPAVDPLLSVASDTQSAVRLMAIEALGAIGDNRSLPKLIEILQSPNEEYFFSKAAAEAIGSIGDTRAIEPLRNAAKSHSWRMVRDAAQNALDRIRCK